MKINTYKYDNGEILFHTGKDHTNTNGWLAVVNIMVNGNQKRTIVADMKKSLKKVLDK